MHTGPESNKIGGFPVYKLEIRRSRSSSQAYYVRGVSAGNSEVLFHTETYRAKADAIKVAQLIGGGTRSIVDLS